jgi:hypothetical protein
MPARKGCAARDKCDKSDRRAYPSFRRCVQRAKPHNPSAAPIAPLDNEVFAYIAKKRYKILTTTIDLGFSAFRAKRDRPNCVK